MEVTDITHDTTPLSLNVAEVFDPDRFLDERLKKYLTPRPFIFLAFNAGPRICLGQQVRIFPTNAPFLTCIIKSTANTVRLQRDVLLPRSSHPELHILHSSSGVMSPRISSTV